MSYPGGKSSSGVYQNIINQIPPHRVFIESHLGGGAILRHKKTAPINIGIDVDPLVLEKWRNCSDVSLIQGDAVEFLSNYDFSGDEFIYVDPPYLSSTRKSKRKIYNYEYSHMQHLILLELLKTLKCSIMISGYASDLYNERLADWRRIEYKARVRSGDIVMENLWMNYPEPTELHDYQYLGCSFRERDRIKKRNSRWKDRIINLPQLERMALLEHLNIINE